MYGAKDYTSADVVEVRGQVTFHPGGQVCQAHYEGRVASGVIVWRAPLSTDGLPDGAPGGAPDGAGDGASDSLLATIDGRLAAEGLRRSDDRSVRWTRSGGACAHGPGGVRVDVMVAVECPDPLSGA